MEYLRGEDYPSDVGNSLAARVTEEIECLKDPDCYEIRTMTVWDWMRQNYVDHMDDNEDTQRKRNEYFDAVKRDVGELIGFKVPRELLAKLINEDIATVSSDAWM